LDLVIVRMGLSDEGKYDVNELLAGVIGSFKK
jgi:hypothetical protein